jgi:hypothetical protein
MGDRRGTGAYDADRMLLIGSALVLAVLVGYAVGGRLRNLEHLRLRWWGLALGGLVLQVAPYPSHIAHWAAFLILLASFVMLIVFGVANRRVMGLPIILFGLCLNLLVIGVNQGMPVTKHALVSSGQGGLLEDLIQHGGAKHHLATSDDNLVFLSDAIGIPKPIGQAVSVGDIFVYAGLIWTIAAAMRGRSRETETAPPREGGSPPEPEDRPSPPETPPRARNRGTAPRS